MTLQLVRGPLPAGHPRAGVQYFCADADVALAACGLDRTPVLQTFAYTERECVLLDAHRAPDEWFESACRMPSITLQGDPDAYRPRACNLFAAELSKQDSSHPDTRPQVQCLGTLSASLPHMLGRAIVLCGSYEVRQRLIEHLRPDGMQAGDGAMDRYGKYTRVHEKLHKPLISVDGGRRMVREDQLDQHVVVSPSCIRSGEYDTVVVMPDVPEMLAAAVCRRARYMIIAVGHSPMAYVPAQS